MKAGFFGPVDERRKAEAKRSQPTRMAFFHRLIVSWDFISFSSSCITCSRGFSARHIEQPRCFILLRSRTRIIMALKRRSFVCTGEKQGRTVCFSMYRTTPLKLVRIILSVLTKTRDYFVFVLLRYWQRKFPFYSRRTNENCRS